MASLTCGSIMDSFIRLPEDRPLNRISVKDIVEDCGIDRNTFYYHFADIPALVEEIEADFLRLCALRHGFTEEMFMRAMNP